MLVLILSELVIVVNLPFGLRVLKHGQVLLVSHVQSSLLFEVSLLDIALHICHLALL